MMRQHERECIETNNASEGASGCTCGAEPPRGCTHGIPKDSGCFDCDDDEQDVRRNSNPEVAPDDPDPHGPGWVRVSDGVEYVPVGMTALSEPDARLLELLNTTSKHRQAAEDCLRVIRGAFRRFEAGEPQPFDERGE